MIRQRLCDSLYSAGRTKDAGESLLKMINTIDEEGSMSDPFIKWVSGEFTFYLFVRHTFNPPSDFTYRCLSVPGSDGDAPTPHTTLDSPPLTLLLREWAKAQLARDLWRDTLLSAVSVSVVFRSHTRRGIDPLLVCSSRFPGS